MVWNVRLIVSAVVTAISGVLLAFGIDISGEQEALIDSIANRAAAITFIGGGIMTAYYKIAGKKKDDEAPEDDDPERR